MDNRKNIAVIGAGPCGLIAAETLAQSGHKVVVYDQMPSPARKFLIAGRGGLNLTHSEPLDTLLIRFREAAGWLTPSVRAFPPEALRAWADGLGAETFVGSSGRVFPKQMKAVNLLRNWLLRLQDLQIEYKPRHTWLGWRDDALLFRTPQSDRISANHDATLLALGGASWPRLGSDGSWTRILEAKNIELSALRPANCGFVVHWSDYFSSRFAGQPLKPVGISHLGHTHQGEAMLTNTGIEGGLVYALSAAIRSDIEKSGRARITLDLRPDMKFAELERKLGGRGSKSLSTYLRSAGLSPVAIALLREAFSAEELNRVNGSQLAANIKCIPLTLQASAGIERAISSAGGIQQRAVNGDFMLHELPGVFVAGEMLDWEAPTGGYLLQACFSTGVAAANGIIAYLR